MAVRYENCGNLSLKKNVKNGRSTFDIRGSKLVDGDPLSSVPLQLFLQEKRT